MRSIAAPSKWDYRFIGIAKEVASWSKDPDTKVGVVIVDDDRHIVSTGYNGIPRGVVDLPCRLTRENGEKYVWVEHAERNALSQAVKSVKGCTMYTTLYPCNDCMKGIIQAGIRKIVYMRKHDRIPHELQLVAYRMVSEAHIETLCIGDQ